MEDQPRLTNLLAKGSLATFILSSLVTFYFIFNLSGEIKIRGDVQNMDLLTPALFNLYLSAAIAFLLACLAVYLEIRNKQPVVVYRDKDVTKSTEETTNIEGSSSERSMEGIVIPGGDDKTLLSNALSAIAKTFEAVSGAAYVSKTENETKWVEMFSGFALPTSDSETVRFHVGEGFVGQAAKSGNSIYIDDIPEGYVNALSGLGSASPKYILVLPVKRNSEVRGVIEIGTFKKISQKEKENIENFISGIGSR